MINSLSEEQVLLIRPFSSVCYIASHQYQPLYCQHADLSNSVFPYLCVCVCAFLWGSAHACVCGSQIVCLPLSFSTLFLRQSFSEPGDQQFGEDSWPASPKVTHLQIFNTEITAHFAIPGFYVGIGVWNSVPHAFMESTLTTRLSPRPFSHSNIYTVVILILIS